MSEKRILVDAREFQPRRRTGIGRFLEGLIDTFAERAMFDQIVLAAFHEDFVPLRIRNHDGIVIHHISASFLGSEKRLSALTDKGFAIFISPYPKLPLFGCSCPAVHTVHDVLDLTHPAYRKRLKCIFDRFRLKRALRAADLTWYVSSWSMEETRRHVGMVGKNPKVRYPALDKGLYRNASKDNKPALSSFQLEPGYILVIGNGSPHKNLGILLEISKKIPRSLVFVGTLQKNRDYWRSRYRYAEAVWLENVGDDDLASLLTGAFCLAQPSTAEGYGYPPLEAMACGVPVVASDIPVLVESTGGHALFAHPHDPHAWINIILSLEKDSIRKDLVKRGKQWVVPKLGKKGWDLFIADIEELGHGH